MGYLLTDRARKALQLSLEEVGSFESAVKEVLRGEKMLFGGAEPEAIQGLMESILSLKRSIDSLIDLMPKFPAALS